MRLVDALTALPTESFLALCRKRGVVFDDQKRISPIEQAARQLVTPRELGPRKELSPDVRRAFATFAAEPAGVLRERIGGAIVPLVEAGLVFAALREPGRFVMPTVYRLQCPPSAADDPRSLRVLLPALDEESMQALVAAHIGRAPAAPRLLMLGDLLEKLESKRVIERAVSELQPKEKALLLEIEKRGSEVELAELLEIAGAPGRYTNPGAGGQLSSRRSPAYPLLKTGLLFPFGKDAYAIPSEVAAIIGKDRRARASKLRQKVRERVASQDLTPQRARFAVDPGPLTVALLAALRAEGVSLAQDVAAPRTVMRKAARSLGVEAVTAEMLVALARADGLYASTFSIREVGARLVRMWRRGSAWDESRTEPDALRSDARFARVFTPTAALIGALFDLLEEIEGGRFALVEDVVSAVLVDLRTQSAAQKLIRLRRRDRDAYAASPEAVLRKIVDETLPSLGLIDRGQSDDGPVMRLAAPARRWLADTDEAPTSVPTTKSASFKEPARLVVSLDAPVSQVLALSDFAIVHAATDQVVATFDDETVERGFHRSIDIADMRARILRISDSMDEKVERMFARVSATRIRCDLVPAAAFVRVPDAALRQAFLNDEAGAKLVYLDSPEQGLLVRAGVTTSRIERILRRLGGELGVIRE